MWAWSPGLVSPISAITSFVSIRMSPKIEVLERGEIPIYEPGLQDLVRANVQEGRLSFTTALEEPVRSADAVFIAVGTPSRRGDGHADLSYVYRAAREIARGARRIYRRHHQVDRAGRHV